MNKSDIIKTTSGKIEGYTEDGLSIFKGIPYAEPPIGDLRFRPPVKKGLWEGVLETTEYGPCAIQGFSRLDEYLGKLEPESEDCLTLNIWTPGTDDKKRPVMVFIHGGAFITGGGVDVMYDGSTLTKRGNVVLVTINYRLGALGFLYVPGQTANVGLLDQILALEWVRDNIEEFGGDPGNITIFGESAGAYSVVTLPAMPAAKGLFHRVIAESSPFIYPEVDKRSSRKFMKMLGVKSGKIEDMRDIPVEKIKETQNKIYASDALKILVFRPLIDKDTLPIHPLKAFQNGSNSDLDFMIGTNLEEVKFYIYSIPQVADASDEEGFFYPFHPYLKLMIGYLGLKGITPEKGNEMVEIYKEATKGEEAVEHIDILAALITDLEFRISTIRLLEAQQPHQPNTFNYLFTWQSPGMDGKLGACHGLELPFVFNTLTIKGLEEFVVENAETNALSEKMMDAWIAFAHSGNPNHEGLPEWPSYNAKNRATMFLGKECKIVKAAFDKERAAWDGILEI